MFSSAAEYENARNEKLRSHAERGLSRGKPGRMKWLTEDDEKQQFIQEMREAGFTKESDELLLDQLETAQRKVLDSWNSMF